MSNTIKLFGLLTFLFSLNPISLASPCACQDRSMCRSLNEKAAWEVVGFSTVGSPAFYKRFDWSKLTTIVAVGEDHLTPDFVCYAQSKGVKVHLLINFTPDVIRSPIAREKIVAFYAAKLKTLKINGYNVDFEQPVDRNGSVYNGLTSLVESLRTAMKKLDASYELTMDYAYCPFCDGKRVYDIMRLMHFLDYIIIMDYDLQGLSSHHMEGKTSIVENGECLTTSICNSPLPVVKRGAEEFVRAGISGSKLVMALPWYGRSNACVKFNAATGGCYVPCSKPYSKYALRYLTIMKILRSGKTEHGRVWKQSCSTPSFTHFVNGQRYQVNYDDPVSLQKKWQVATALGFRGAGIWNIDFLDYSSNVNATDDRKAMWGSIPKGFHSFE